MESHPIRLTRKELYDKVWAQPVHTLAKEYGISDVGLKKICKRRDIPTPGLGYWAKVAHGKRVRRVPLPPAKPEQSDIIEIHGAPEYGPA
jgi:hypothetical protein